MPNVQLSTSFCFENYLHTHTTFLHHKTYSYQFPKGILTMQERKAMWAAQGLIEGVSVAEKRSKLREIKVQASGVGCKAKSSGSSGGAWCWPDTGARSTQVKNWKQWHNWWHESGRKTQQMWFNWTTCPRGPGRFQRPFMDHTNISLLASLDMDERCNKWP